jgi:exopolysaccharide biosynthesis operon protein EpsL
MRDRSPGTCPSHPASGAAGQSPAQFPASRASGPASGWLRAATICAAIILPATDAAALWDDKVELFVAETVTYDDNVFRISGSLDPVTTIGSSSRADTYYTTSPGFKFDVALGRQRFAGGVTWNFARYERFTVLDFDGHDGRAAWQWKVGNDWSGTLGYTDTLALASLENSRAGILTGTPNSLATRRGFFNAAYAITPRWRVQGEAGRLEQDNGLAALTVNDIVINSGDLAVSYITPAGNQLGVGARLEDGRYPNRPGGAVNLAGDAYRQYSVDLIAEYTMSGHSRVRARAGRVTRNHEQLSQRDFDEGTFNVTYDWRPTGMLTLSAVARREVSPLDDTQSSFVLLKGVALYPTLQLSEKVSAAVALEYSSRDYLNDPSLVLVGSRTDWLRVGGLKLTYRPVRSLTLEIGYLYQSRSSTIAFGDFEANIATLSVRIGF